MGSDAPPLRV
jgi:hypothetical protein